MTVKSIVRGVTVGATVGTVCYMMSKATSKQKHDIRKNAGKAVKAAGCILDDITSLMWGTIQRNHAGSERDCVIFLL